MNWKSFLGAQNKEVALDYQHYITSNSCWNEVGVVSFDLPLLSNFSVSENIMLPLMYSEGVKRSIAEPLVYELLKKFDMHHLMHAREKRLNGHEVLIVKYLRAIIRRPEAVVFIMPSIMLQLEDYDIFILFTSSLIDFDVTIIETERYSEDYLAANFTGVTYEKWQTHVLDLLK